MWIKKVSIIINSSNLNLKETDKLEKIFDKRFNLLILNILDLFIC